MKRNGRLQRLLGRFSNGSRHTGRGVRLRPEVLLLEDRCLPSISLPQSPWPVGQTVGGQFGDLWYARAGGATVGHVSADGTVQEFSAAQDIETDVYGNLWSAAVPSYGVTLNRLTPAGNQLSIEYPNWTASVNALGTPPDSFLPHLLFEANGNADLVVVDQDGNASLVAAPMTTDSTALRNAWGPVPVVAKQEGALGQDTALWYPDGSGIDRLDYYGAVQHFSPPAGNTDVVATLGIGPDQNIWFVEAGQDSSTGAFYADKIGELFSNGKMVEASLGSQGDRLKITGMVAASDGSSLWFDQVGLQSDGVSVQPGTERIGQVNFDKTVTYTTPPSDGGSLQTTAIGPDGAAWIISSTDEGGYYESDISQTSISVFSASTYGDPITLGQTPPEADNLSVTTNQDTAVTAQLPVTENDGDTLQFSMQSNPDNGTVVVNNDGTFTYTPHGGYTGVDTFNYAVDDGQGGMAVGTVTVTVNPVNHAPFAGDANELVFDNNPVDDVLPVSDLDGNPLQVTITSGPAHGTVNIYGDQGAPGGLGDIRFTYTPYDTPAASGNSGSDSFTYLVSDGQGGTASGTVTLTPYANVAPTAQDGNVSTYVDTAASGRLPAFDANGDFLTPTILSQPTHGYVSLPDPGRPGSYGDTTFTYYPNAGYVGTDSFTYQVDDGNGGIASANVSVTVSPLYGTTTVFVDQHWANLNYGDAIANPDPLNPNASSAMFGYNAFASINGAVSEATAIFAANPSAGVVVVNGANGDTGSGIFHEDVVDSSAVPVSVQQGLVTVDSLAGNNAAASIALHGVNLNAGGDNASTEYDGTLTGTGGVAKSGTGTMILTGNNTYSGGTNVANGTLKVAADANLGTGNITGAALGTLEFTGTTTTAKSFAMGYGTIVADAGNTVTFNGSQVSSAYLAGAGTFATNATNGTQFSAVTSTPSATIDSNSGNDQFVNFDNSATLNVAAQINTNGTSTIKLFNGFTNEGSGQITVGSGSRVNVDRFTSYGTLTLNPATVSGQYTLLKNLGSTNLNFLTGSKTYIGTPATAGTIVAGVDLHGMNALVSGTTILVSSSPNVYATGALFVNNGFVASSGGSASLTVDGNNSTQGNVHGALYKGAGTTFVSIITQNGGAVQAGNSPGVDNFSQFTFGSGAVSNYVFAIDDATGVAGPHPDSQGHVDGWSMVNADNFTWTAAADHPLTVALQSLVNPTTVGTDVSGPMDNFDPRNSYVWEAIHWTCAYDGPSDAASLTDSTVFDNSGIVNSAGGKFSWQLDAAAKTLSLVYIPPPAVAGVQLNSGADGSVRSLTATFSTSVSFANGDAAAAFRLTNSDTGATVDLSATVSTDAQGRTVVTLTFSGGALAADHYRLSILGTAVTGADGAALDGSGTGTGSGIDYLGPTWTVGG